MKPHHKALSAVVLVLILALTVTRLRHELRVYHYEAFAVHPPGIRLAGGCIICSQGCILEQQVDIPGTVDDVPLSDMRSPNMKRIGFCYEVTLGDHTLYDSCKER